MNTYKYIQAYYVCKEYGWLPPYTNKDMYALMKQKGIKWHSKEGKWIPSGVVDPTLLLGLYPLKNITIVLNWEVLNKEGVQVFLSISLDEKTGKTNSSDLSLFHNSRDEDRISKFVNELSEIGLTCEIFRFGIKTPEVNILVRNTSILIAEYIANKF